MLADVELETKRIKKCTCTNNVLRIPIHPYFSFIVSNENSLVYNYAYNKLSSLIQISTNYIFNF